MGKCDYPGCSGDSTIQNSCSYCLSDYCSAHRLPERHNCPALANTKTLGPDFRDEFDITADTTNDGTHCSNCQSTSVVFGEEFCEDCLQDMTGNGEKSQCEQCLNYTSPEFDLCLECRRQEQTIDSKSPDILLDGSLDNSTNDPNATNSDEIESKGIVARLKSVFQRG